MTQKLLLPLFIFVSSVVVAEPPRLVLQITVDQLRGDMLPRYREEFATGGFRWLLDHGIYFSNAHYGSANTFTASGHAVLVTGADASGHGMVANEWFDRVSGKIMYCTADPTHPILGEPAKPGSGMSPANLASTTIGDELVAASAGRSRAFAVGGKDRSSIIPGGHLGKAFWYSEVTGGFVSSSYYYDALPAWVPAWNAQKLCDSYRSLEWKPLRDPATYRFAGARENSHARPNATLGRTFPHPLLAKSDPLFLAALRFTPFFDELIAAFARELITHEKVGQGAAPDYVSISFTATDYIGHAYGPNSVEAEDNLMRLDATLAGLLAFVDKTVGLKHTFIVLSADHGVDDIPEARRAAGYDAQRIYPEKLRERANTALKSRFDVVDDLVVAFVPPGFYLNRPRIAALKLDPAVVEKALAEELRQAPGVACAFTRTDLVSGSAVGAPFGPHIERGFHEKRSGDVVIVQDQFWYMYPDPEIYAAMHGSPYSYDTFVPIIFAGSGMATGVVNRSVEPAGIAPTLAALLHVNAPSACRATVLPEVFAHTNAPVPP